MGRLAKASSRRPGKLCPQCLQQVLGPSRPDDVDGSTITKVWVQSLEPPAGHVRLVEPRQFGEDELQHVDPLCIAKIGWLTLLPTSDLSGIDAECGSELALGSEVIS